MVSIFLFFLRLYEHVPWYVKSSPKTDITITSIKLLSCVPNNAIVASVIMIIKNDANAMNTAFMNITPFPIN